MIDKIKLLQILIHYGVKLSSSKRKQIEESSRPEEVEEILRYLIEERKISSRNISKCTSILQQNPKSIRKNYEFLTSKPIHIYNVETCLHILEASPTDLEDTYLYVEKNFGLKAMNKNTSILGVKKSRIEEIVYLFGEVLEKDVLL